MYTIAPLLLSKSSDPVAKLAAAFAWATIYLRTQGVKLRGLYLAASILANHLRDITPLLFIVKLWLSYVTFVTELRHTHVNQAH